MPVPLAFVVVDPVLLVEQGKDGHSEGSRGPEDTHCMASLPQGHEVALVRQVLFVRLSLVHLVVPPPQ